MYTEFLKTQFYAAKCSIFKCTKENDFLKRLFNNSFK